VKNGLRVLSAENSNPERWTINYTSNPKGTQITVTAVHKGGGAPSTVGAAWPSSRYEEVLQWLLQVDSEADEVWEEGRVVWTVQYVMEVAGNATNWTPAVASPPKVDRHRAAYKHHRRQAAVAVSAGRRRTARLSGAATKMIYLDGVNGVLDGIKRKISARFEIHKDDTEAVLPISKVRTQNRPCPGAADRRVSVFRKFRAPYPHGF